MIRFHIICAEVSDDLTERINQWIAEMGSTHNPRNIVPTVPRFQLKRWHISHNGDLIYWTVEYTI